MSTNDVGVLWLEAATRDGVTITVNAVAQAFVADPAANASYQGSPRAATLAAAEAEIRRYVRGARPVVGCPGVPISPATPVRGVATGASR